MIHARQALLASGWAQDVRITLKDGRIDQIAPNTAAQTGDMRVDTLLPA